jgi:adenosylcobyric acid synthase
LESFERLAREFDLIVVEGADSPAEVNLRARDIANIGFARRAGVPVCVLGDIDRGGVIASIVGTWAVLEPAGTALINSFAINKFRGDPALFTDGMREIEARTGWPYRSVVPWLDAARCLPQEDAMVLDSAPFIRSAGHAARLKIVAPMLSRIANFDDADPLRMEADVDFEFVRPGDALPRDADVVLLLGTKNTLADLEFLRAQGWHHDIMGHARVGGWVTGLCGGLQILGQTSRDPYGVDSGVDGGAGEALGLGLLQVETTMRADKSVRPAGGHCARSGVAWRGGGRL